MSSVEGPMGNMPDDHDANNYVINNNVDSLKSNGDISAKIRSQSSSSLDLPDITMETSDESQNVQQTIKRVGSSDSLNSQQSQVGSLTENNDNRNDKNDSIKRIIRQSSEPEVEIRVPRMQRLARHSVASVVSTQSRDSIESANMYNHRSSISVVRGPGGAGNRWAKLRTTVKATNIVSEPAKRKRKASNLSRQDSFLKRFSTRHGVHGNDSDGEGDEEKSTIGRNSLECKSVRRKFVIHPVENVMFLWLGFITAACLYNIWTSIAREAFTEIQDGYLPVWFACDAICDFLYLFDVVVQLRTGFLEKGLLVYNSKKLAHHYVKSHYFIVDLITLLPLDLLQLYIGIHPLLRFPRFLKCYRAGQFKNMVESRTMYPNLWRVVNLCHILFLFSHWFAAFYYLISKSEDYTGVWAYPKPVGPYADVTRKYLKSLYWSTLTLTTIGDLPPPDTNWQYVFTILSYLLGVFCFATIVGQVGNVITNRNANRLEFERLLDGAKNYMRTHNVPPDMQRRVQRWYDYAWSRYVLASWFHSHHL